MNKKTKYSIIEDYFIENIKSGNLKNGDKIMTEHELCNKFNTSRMTVNKALQSLSSKGYIRRVTGSGSFVSDSHVYKKIGKPISFSDDMKSIGLKPGAQLIEYRIFRGKDIPEIASKLGVSENEFIHYFCRIRTGNDEKIALSYTYISSKIIPALDVSRLDSSFYEYVKELGLNVTAMDLKINATIPTPTQKELLDIHDNSALLKTSHITFLDNSQIFEYIETFYIGSKYTYHFSNLE